MPGRAQRQVRRLVLGRVRRAAALVAATLLLAGCGGRAEEAPPVVSASAPGSPSASSPPSSEAERPGGGREQEPGDPAEEPSLDEGALGDLAELAEQSMGEQRRRLAASGPVLGGDISWPQCPRGLGIPERPTLGLPLPVLEARYVVIGLTNGPALTENPCLADQVAASRDAGLLLASYAVTSFPDAETLAAEGDEGPFDGDTTGGALANTGYRQAAFGVGEMERTGLESPVVWVDVEPVADFEWSSDLAANAAVVEGVVRGYEDAGYEVGIYSTPYLWAEIVGDLELGLPEWRAAGETSRAEALERCGPDWSIQGGVPVMGQWVEDSRDQNVTCPGISADLGRWFADPR